MTAYINSVQQVSITIAALSTTGTATITATVGTPFLIFQGQTTSALALQSEALCIVSISGTTVTATRSLGTAGSCVVNVAIVDATSSLVKSVQMGTITLAANTGTATITSVTTTNSAVALLGYTSSPSTFNYSVNTPTLVLTNSTTVTASLDNQSGTVIAGYVVVEFQGAALNQSTQAKSVSWANTSISTTKAVTSVNVNNSMVFFAGSRNGANETAAYEQQTVQLTSGTVATITAGATAGADSGLICNFTVVEFITGVLSQNAQRGTIVISAGTSNTATVTSATAVNTLCNFTGYRTPTTATTSYAPILPNLTQTNATTLTETLNSSGSATVAYEVLTFTVSAGGSTIVTRRTYDGLGTRTGSRQAV